VVTRDGLVLAARILLWLALSWGLGIAVGRMVAKRSHIFIVSCLLSGIFFLAVQFCAGTLHSQWSAQYPIESAIHNGGPFAWLFAGPTLVTALIVRDRICRRTTRRARDATHPSI
jgi:hypothetical protein